MVDASSSVPDRRPERAVAAGSDHPDLAVVAEEVHLMKAEVVVEAVVRNQGAEVEVEVEVLLLLEQRKKNI